MSHAKERRNLRARVRLFDEASGVGKAAAIARRHLSGRDSIQMALISATSCRKWVQMASLD